MADGTVEGLTKWERYWRYVSKTRETARVTWDVQPEFAAMEDLQRFASHMNPQLPLLDLGCGTGRQTRFLAQHFRRVIGADISQAAIDLAKRETVTETNVAYRVLNCVRPEEAEALHAEFGDMNVYMRGVLHLIAREDRANFIASIAALLGKTGTLYQLELTSEAVATMLTVRGSYLFASSVGFDNVVELETCFPAHQWTIVESGHDAVIWTVDLFTAEERPIPANYVVARCK